MGKQVFLDLNCCEEQQSALPVKQYISDTMPNFVLSSGITIGLIIMVYQFWLLKFQTHWYNIKSTLHRCENEKMEGLLSQTIWEMSMKSSMKSVIC